MIQKQANYVLAIGILNYFMHHIAPFVEFDRYNICAAGFIYSSEPVNFPLVLYYNVSWSDKFYMYYHSPLQTFLDVVDVISVLDDARWCFSCCVIRPCSSGNNISIQRLFLSCCPHGVTQCL